MHNQTESVIFIVMKTASWVIVRKSDGKALFETFEQKTADAWSNQFPEKYKVVPILEYLQSLNK